MRSILFIILGLGSVVAFGQSAKKLNKDLKKELEMCKTQSGPLLEAYQKKKLEMDLVLGEVKHRGYLAKEAELPAKEFFLKTVQLIKDLKMLGVDAKTVIGTDSVPPFTDYQGFVKDISDLLKNEDRGVGLLSGTPNLKGLDTDEQNRILKDLVHECSTYSRNLTYRLNKLEPDQKRLQAAIPKMDSMILVYQSLAPALRAKKVKLERKLMELRENYRLKGPAGFSVGYKIVFPEVFGSAEEGPVYADQTKPDAVEPKTDIYTFVEEDAQFPGGNDALKKYLAENVHYPEIAYELGIVGKHVVQFVITTDGSISQVKMKKGLPDCPECDAEVIRVVKGMPKWVPAKVNGKAVDSYYALPFSIHL